MQASAVLTFNVDETPGVRAYHDARRTMVDLTYGPFTVTFQSTEAIDGMILALGQARARFVEEAG